ncbi:MAG: hypothetical protein AB8E15_06030 [Bdellovibrionales bacterium]
MGKILVVFATIFAVIGTGVYLYYNENPTNKERRLRRIKNNIHSLKTTNKCLSILDCKMVILPTQDCIPIDYMISYTKKDKNTPEIIQLISKYKSLYREVHGRKQNYDCARYNKPKLRCLKGECKINAKSTYIEGN